MLNQLLVQQKTQTQSLLQPLLSRLDNLEGNGYETSSDIEVGSADEEDEMIPVRTPEENGSSRRPKRIGAANASEILSKQAKR